MTSGKAVAVIVVGSVAAAAAAAAAGTYALLTLRSKKGSKSALKPLRQLQSMMSRKPASWYESLPLYKLKNNKGMEVWISALGASITKLVVPDAKGRKSDVVLGYDDVEDYVKAPCTYFGVVVGRVANRIANGKFKLDGQEYNLLVNNGPNSLHGGHLGLHKRRWMSRESKGDDYTGVELTYESCAGEEGYPGNLFITVTYKLSKDSNQLTTTITATTDEATPVNIAQHSYFNLSGHNSGTILGHELTIHGDHYLPVGDTQIPTGQIVPVKGTPFDFTEPHAIGDRIDKVPGGYDHNYVLFNMGPQARFIVKNGMASDKPKLAATVHDPKSGRTMDVLTTAPGVQFYSGNFLDGAKGKGEASYPKHGGLCLETQGFPDAVNQAAFPSIILQPDHEYRHEIVYKFS